MFLCLIYRSRGFLPQFSITLRGFAPCFNRVSLVLDFFREVADQITNPTTTTPQKSKSCKNIRTHHHKSVDQNEQCQCSRAELVPPLTKYPNNKLGQEKHSTGRWK